ncbi:MAG: TrmB family transcriptional regulator [Halohasta sp.]
MTTHRSDQHSTAIEQLEAFRLSTYAARTFVALSSLGTGTAKEVSQVAEVPRTRVYDAVEELRDRGLVDVQHSSPRRFIATSAETTRRKLDQETQHRLTKLTTALDQLEAVDNGSEQRGIWTVTGKETIADRLLTFFQEADSEIVYVADEGFLSERLIEGLSAAVDRGISVSVGGLSAGVIDRLQDEIPAVERIDPAARSIPMVSRFLLVDGSRTLLSVQVGNPTPDAETAIWGAGETNNLVVILKSICGFTDGLTDGDQ